MSAFICGTQTYSRIYTGLEVFNRNTYPNTEKKIKEILSNQGSIPGIIEKLYRLNVRAVNQRYNELTSETTDNEKLESMCQSIDALSAGQFLMSLECLRYQMSEGDVVNEALYYQIGELTSALRFDGVHNTATYKNAEWD